MKFLCSNCKAKYQIADDRVAGRTLRMTCRRCQQEIVIRGEPTGHPSSVSIPAPIAPRVLSPPPSALGADFQMQVASSLHSPLPQPPMLDEWHVAINDVPVGPMRREEVARKLAVGAIDSESLAWREGLDDWLPIRQLPELAVLITGAGSLAPQQPPSLLIQPGQRPELSPLGGRAGAAPYMMESWAPIEQSSGVMINPLLESSAGERRAPALPSWPMMFALAGGFAFLMSALAILGARFLQDEPAQAPTAGAAGSAAPVAPSKTVTAEEPAVELPEIGGVVIAVDDPAAQNTRSGGTRPRSDAQSKTSKSKQLTAEQREMLARMGGSNGTDISGLSNAVEANQRAAKVAGSLTQADLTKVVQRGRKNLQRCYETALRGSNSTDAVRLDVEINVSAAGNVTSVKVAGDGLPGMSTCIERTVKMWRFPASDDAAATRFPVVFQPGA